MLSGMYVGKKNGPGYGDETKSVNLEGVGGGFLEVGWGRGNSRAKHRAQRLRDPRVLPMTCRRDGPASEG